MCIYIYVVNFSHTFLATTGPNGCLSETDEFIDYIVVWWLRPIPENGRNCNQHSRWDEE